MNYFSIRWALGDSVEAKPLQEERVAGPKGMQQYSHLGNHKKFMFTLSLST